MWHRGFVDVVKNPEIILVDPWDYANPKCPYKREVEGDFTQKQKVICSGNRERFQDGMLLTLKVKEEAKAREGSLEAGNGEEALCSLGLLDGAQPCWHLDFGPVKLTSGFQTVR